jgi:serine/threonine-protein kinase HipA
MRRPTPKATVAHRSVLELVILVSDRYKHLCPDAARRAGLLAVRTQVARIAEETAVVVERYDRRLAADGVVRVHQEDVCQEFSVPPAGKYQNEGGPGPREITGLLNRLMPSGAASAAAWRFAGTLIWNCLIAATDARARNCSILLAADDVRFAPLYDVSLALSTDWTRRSCDLR